MRSMMKWEKFKILKQHTELAALLPETKWMTVENFWALMNKYRTVILKPYNGFGGHGVIKVSHKADSFYEIHCDQTKHNKHEKTLFSFLKSRIRNQGYLVQQWIDLAEVNGRPFDLRVMVQKRKSTPWTVTGKLVKVAGKGYIVTNIKTSHGMVLPIETAFQRSSLKIASLTTLIKSINNIALKTAKCLQPFYPQIHMMGLDLGVDKSGKPWIIEVNFGPAMSLFLYLKDKRMYRQILQYKK
jgi:glutathione synthase/RimK-type ligase-like ATP-grasp enzyme